MKESGQKKGAQDEWNSAGVVHISSVEGSSYLSIYDASGIIRTINVSWD